MLNPENSAFLNKLMGNTDDRARTMWWDENIRPIWGRIKENFYEDTIFSRETRPDYDYMFRRANKLQD